MENTTLRKSSLAKPAFFGDHVVLAARSARQPSWSADSRPLSISCQPKKKPFSSEQKINCGAAEANKSPEGSGNPLESLVDLRFPAIIDQLPLSGNIHGAFMARSWRVRGDGRSDWPATVACSVRDVAAAILKLPVCQHGDDDPTLPRIT
ncbi:MAG: hypothetical protein OXE85_01105 [Roseovarius sp.]|nr:hypothetical protein [Roseovarius sp.]